MSATAWADWFCQRRSMALLLGGSFWVAWAISYGLGSGWFDVRGQLIGVDHLAFYSAARLLADNQPHRLYDHPSLCAFQSELVGKDWPYFEAYRNPPFYALLYVPTCRWSYLHSFVFWSVIGLICLALGLYGLRPDSWASAMLGALTFYPVFAVISFGQNSLLSFAILVAVFRMLQQRRDFLAGLIAGLLLFKPQLLLGLGIWWLIEIRNYARSWIGLATTAMALLLISGLIVPQASEAFLTTLRTNAGYGGFGLWNMHNPRAFFTLLLPGFPALALLLAALAGLGAILGYALWLKRAKRSTELAFAGAILVTLWASPHTMIYEWSLALIPAAILWHHCPQQRSHWWVLFGIAWLALTFSTPLARLQIDYLPLAVQPSVPILGWVIGRSAQLCEFPVSADAPTR